MSVNKGWDMVTVLLFYWVAFFVYAAILAYNGAPAFPILFLLGFGIFFLIAILFAIPDGRRGPPRINRNRIRYHGM